MGNMAKYAAINTKIEAMESKLLSEKDYSALIECKSVSDIAEYLKCNTHFKSVLNSYSTETLRRTQFEHLLQTTIVQKLRKLENYLGTAHKFFYKAFLMKFEINDIRLMLRGISKNIPLKNLQDRFLHIEEFENVNFEKLLTIENFQDFINCFEGTVYESAFRNITESDLKIREFHMEMNLNAVYFINLLKLVDKLPKEDRLILRKLIGTNIDLINLQWVYRGKKYYDLLNEEILNYTLPGGYKLSFQYMKKLIYSDSFQETVDAMIQKFNKSFTAIEDITMQISVNKFLYHEYKQNSKKYPMTAAKILLYSKEIEYEINDIISIIEGIRYGYYDMSSYLIKISS